MNKIKSPTGASGVDLRGVFDNNGQGRSGQGSSSSLAEIESALTALDSSCNRDEWAKIAMALKDGLGENGFQLFDQWSAGGSNYNPTDTRDTWRSIRPGGGISIRTLFGMARDAGWEWRQDRPIIWKEPRQTASPSLPDDPVQTPEAIAKIREKLRFVWAASIPLDHDDAEPARHYLTNRGLNEILVDLPGPDVLRFHPALTYWHDRHEVGRFPTLVALVQGPRGQAVTIHRSYLNQVGCKADVSASKKLMTATHQGATQGAAIRLYPAGDRLGVAEGIENALAVRIATGLPVWATISEGCMRRFEPPKWVRLIDVWADLDRSGVGQRAAEDLARRLTRQGIKVRICTPPGPIPKDCKGMDWLDVLNSWRAAA